MQRYLWLCLLGVLPGCRTPPAYVFCNQPGERCASPGAVLTRQIVSDTAVELTYRPLHSSESLLAESGHYLGAAFDEFFGKRLAMRLLGPPCPLSPDRPPAEPAVLEADLRQLIGSELEPAHIQLYPDGAEALAALKGVIDQATCQIDILMFQWEDDSLGATVAAWLADRASDHVRVRILVDGGGNLLFGVPQDARTGDVNQVVNALAGHPHVEVLRTRNPFGCFDHRKLVLVDGRVAWTGGRNFTHKSFFDQRDLSFVIAGPLVDEFQTRFNLFWQYQGGEPAANHEEAAGEGNERPPPPDAVPYSVRAAAVPPSASCLPPDHAPNALARLASTGPEARHLGLVLYRAVDDARAHVYLENFCCCDSGLVTKLARARHRGVDVRVVMTTNCGLDAVDHANRVIANRLYRAGVRVYLSPVMVHTKAATVDGCWAYLGTGNFDALSLRHNRELGLAIGAGPVIGELEEKLFLPDFRPEWELTGPLPLCAKDYAWELLANFCL